MEMSEESDWKEKEEEIELIGDFSPRLFFIIA